MTMAVPRLFLCKEASLHAQLHKMAEEPSYRPGRTLQGVAGLLQVREALEDLRHLMSEVKAEGDS